MNKTTATMAVLLLTVLSAHAGEKIKVVTFSTILTEIAQKVGGDRIEVIGLVKPGVDPHEYQPKPEDLKQVSEGQLILLSAKHMEHYLTKLKEVTNAQGFLVEVGDHFPSLRMESEEGEPGQHGSVEDPHWWHSIENMKSATAVVCDELSKIDPADKATFAVNADAYTKELGALERWAKSEIAKLPRDKRKLVTSHDAFGYLARDFGFTVHPISGISPEDEPSSKKVSDLIETIKKQGVKSVFFESMENPKVVKEITKESGAAVGGMLYADGLGEGDAGTYDGMFRHNVTTIVNGLK